MITKYEAREAPNEAPGVSSQDSRAIQLSGDAATAFVDSLFDRPSVSSRLIERYRKYRAFRDRNFAIDETGR